MFRTPLVSLTLAAALTACAPTTPVAPTAAVPSEAPAAPAVESNVIAGQVTIKGQPVANARLRLTDALTEADAILMADDGSLVAGERAYAATDAEGRFSVRVVGLNPRALVRVTAVDAEGRTVSALVSGSGLTLDGYRVAQTTFEIAVNEISRAIDMVARGPLSLMHGTLTSEASAGPETTLLGQLQAVAATLTEQARTNPEAAAKLAALAAIQDPAALAAAVTQTLSDLGVADAVRTAVVDTLNAVAEKAETPENVATGYDPDAVSTVTLTGTDLTVSANAGGVTVKDAKGETVATVSTTPPSGGGNTTGNPPATGGTSSGGSSSTPTFEPTIESVLYSGTTFTTRVKQAAGQNDIGEVYVRVPVASVGLADLALPAFDELDTSDASTVALGSTTMDLDVARDAAATDTVTLPEAFGGGAPGTLLWGGYLKAESSGANMAKFFVFEGASHYHLVTLYNLTDSVLVTGGHTTTLATQDALTSVANGAALDVVFKSRRGQVHTVTGKAIVSE